MKKIRAQKRESLILIILLVMLIGGSIFSYPCFSYALGSGGSGLSSLLGGGSGLISSLLGGRNSSGSTLGSSTSTAGNGTTFSVTTITHNTTYTLADGIKKDLAITIWYPSSGNTVAAADAPYPLVVFSHGMLLGTATQSKFITQGLAAQGYIVCATTHEDSIFYRGGSKDASPLTEGNYDRPLDVQAIITEMLRLNNTSDSIFYGTIDENAIGMMGHSLGGWTSEIICGGTAPGKESYADPRVKAGVLFDPASLPPQAFSSIHVPIMCFFGENSSLEQSRLNTNIYESLNPPKYVATVAGLSHMDFADLGRAKPGAQAVLQYTIAFFDRYLKGDLSAEQTLQTKDQTFIRYRYSNTSTVSATGVTVYTAPGCVYCDRVKQFLKEKDVPFTEKDVINDKMAGQEMIAKTGQTDVPVTVINGKYVVGDNLDAIEKLLASSTTSGQTSAQTTSTNTQTTGTQQTTTGAQTSAQTTSTGSNSLSGLSSLLGSGSGSGILSKLLGSAGGSTSTAGNGTTFSVTTITHNTTYTLADGIKKDLAITIWYPSSGNTVAAADAPYPLVVFSHGMLLGNATQSRFITQGLAGKGYIVCATTHEDSIYYRGTKDASPLTQGFNDRPLDVQAIITEMLRLNNSSDSIFYGTIDENAIGMMGHSLGGWTSELICGGTPPGQESFADQRVKAGVLFDPASISAVFSNIHVPMMCFFGANSFMKVHGNTNIYESLNPPKYVVTVAGLSHMDFSDLGSAKPGAQAVLQYTIAFFDRYLKGDLSAEQTLRTKDQTFTSYEYDLGAGDEGTAAGSQGSGNDWEEVPAYGSELEEVASWQETPAYSVKPGETGETSSDEVIDFGALLRRTNNNKQAQVQTSSSFSQIAQEILQLVNQHRASQGLPALQMNSTLTNLAAAHSEDMAEAGQGPNHDGFTERFQTIRDTLGGAGGVVAENAYASFDYGNDIAENAVARWLGSSGHRGNIENDKFTLTGIGIARSSQGEYYFTQIFFESPIVSGNSIGAGQETPASGAEADKMTDFGAMLGTASNSDDSSSNISSGLAAGGAGESAAGSNTATPPPVKVERKDVEEIAQELFNLVSKKYLGYQENSLLAELAVTHSQDMAQKNQACNNDGIQERFNQINGIIPGHYYAEVVAGPYKYSNDLAEKVFKRWLESTNYEAAATNWRAVGAGAVPITGIGVARSSTGNYYFTQILWGMRQ